MSLKLLLIINSYSFYFSLFHLLNINFIKYWKYKKKKLLVNINIKLNFFFIFN